MRRRIRHIPLAFALAAVLGGCSDKGTVLAPGNTATLRVVHAVGVNRAISLSWRGSRAMQVPAEGQTLSFAVGSGAGDLVVSAPGSGLTSSTRQYSLGMLGRYDIVVVDSAGIVIPRLLGDTNATVPAGKSKLRVVHAAAHAPPIDIWRTQPDFMTMIRVQFPFDYLDVSPYLQSDPGDWQILVTPAGGTDTLYLSPPIPVADGKLVTVTVVDSLSHSGVWATVTADN
jgi:hypothetical protein